MKNRIMMLTVFLLAVMVFATVAGAQEAQKNASSGKKPSGNTSFTEVQKAVRNTLDGMVEAYTSKNAKLFMSYVSEDYTKDDALLNRKIRRDFGKFLEMDLRYTLNNVTTDSRNENIAVTVTFSRSYTNIKTTKRINKTGMASMIFRMVDGRPRLWSMKGPSMFGI